MEGHIPGEVLSHLFVGVDRFYLRKGVVGHGLVLLNGSLFFGEERVKACKLIADALHPTHPQLPSSPSWNLIFEHMQIAK